MNMNAINGEVGRLETKLAAINQEIVAYAESASDMLKYVITFSALVKKCRSIFQTRS